MWFVRKKVVRFSDFVLYSWGRSAHICVWVFSVLPHFTNFGNSYAMWLLSQWYCSRFSWVERKSYMLLLFLPFFFFCFFSVSRQRQISCIFRISTQQGYCFQWCFHVRKARIRGVLMIVALPNFNHFCEFYAAQWSIWGEILAKINFPVF